MAMLRNKWVLMGLAAVGGYLAYRWWKRRNAPAAPQSAVPAK